MNDIKTVADGIRSMNDEELMMLLSQIIDVAYEKGYNDALHRKQMNKEVGFGPVPGMGS